MANNTQIEFGTSTTTRKKYESYAETVSDYSEDPSPTPPDDGQPTSPLEASAAEEEETRDEGDQGDGEVPEHVEDARGTKFTAAAGAPRKADKVASKTKAKMTTSSKPATKNKSTPKPMERTLASTREKRRNAGETPHDAVGTGRRDEEAGASTDAAVASKKTASTAVPSKKKTRPSAKLGTRPTKSARKATAKVMEEAASPDDARVLDANAADAEHEASRADAQEDNVGITDAEHEVPGVHNVAATAVTTVTTVTSISDMATAIENVLRHCATVADTFVNYTRARDGSPEADAANARFDVVLKRNRSGGESTTKKHKGD